MSDQAHIAHRIRERGDLRGKPRVFLAMHPADREKYLEKLIGILHGQLDCVLYYVEDGDGQIGADRLPETLDDIQLIVAAVTGRLLRGSNEAIDGIIPYALDHNIPVLPLMMEEGLNDKYKKRFGDLQYLVPDDPDRTAIPFDQKLRAFLQEVIVSDETAGKVRDAFDALIFLSYRKKDRAYARELMRLVHRCSGCRDIAFWYDEFLVPGEDFNDGIRRSLDESDLFMLVVTPSLLEDPNFVLLHEYPAARAAGKKIFPVEMLKTGRQSLEKLYEELPPCVRGTGDEKWNAALAEQVKRLAVRTGRDDPGHKFLIGLAYLDGINMEVDTGRGAALIREAAEAGLEEAMRRLSAMYASGKGVKRNADEALRWQKELCDKLWDRYRGLPADDPPRARELLETMDRDLNKLTDRLYKTRKLREVYSCLHAYKTLLEETEDDLLPGRKHSLAVCCAKIGDIETAVDDTFRAEGSYRRSAELFGEILGADGSDSAKCDLYIALRGLTQTLRRRYRNEEALCEIDRILSLLDSIGDPEFAASLSNDLSGMHRLRGQILADLKREEEAGEEFKKALDIAEEAYAARPGTRTGNGLSDICDILRIMSFRKGDDRAGEEYTRREAAIVENQLKEAIEKGTQTVHLRNLLGLFHTILREKDAAAACYRSCLEADEEDPDSPAVLKARADACFALSELMPEGDREDHFRQGVALAERLIAKTGAPEYIAGLADRIEKRAGDDPDRLEEAFEWRQDLTERIRDHANRIRRDSLREKIDLIYEKHPETKKPRIMICGADDSLREQILSALKDTDCRICRSRPGMSDLPDLHAAVRPDLTILVLPREGGPSLEPLRFLKRSIDKNARFIAIARRDDRGAADEALALGAAECLKAPADMTALKAAAARQCALIRSTGSAE